MRRINFKPKYPKFKKVFENTGDTFSGVYSAEKWLRENGFSSGSTDCGSYVAITKGEYNLPQKIHNFYKEDLEQMAGVIYSTDYRNGKVEIWLYEEFEEKDRKKLLPKCDTCSWFSFSCNIGEPGEPACPDYVEKNH